MTRNTCLSLRSSNDARFAPRLLAEHIKADRPCQIGTLAYYMPIDYTLSSSATEFSDAPTVENVTRLMLNPAETDR